MYIYRTANFQKNNYVIVKIYPYPIYDKNIIDKKLEVHGGGFGICYPLILPPAGRAMNVLGSYVGLKKYEFPQTLSKTYFWTKINTLFAKPNSTH